MRGLKIRKSVSLSKIGGRDVLEINLTNTNLTITYAKVSAGRKEFIRIFHRDISSLDDNDISKLITNFFSELKIKAAPFVINIVPAHLVITKNIEIPSTDPKEIDEIIKLQAGRHTPYSREEIIVDHIHITTYKQSYTKILIVIVARSVIRRYFDIINKAGLSLDKVYFASESLVWFTSKKLKLNTDKAPLNLIHIDQAYTDFTVIFKNNLIFIRSIPLGAQHLADEKEDYRSKFVEEIKKSFEAYQSEDIEKSPEKVVLTGATEEAKGLEATLSETLHLAVSSMSYLSDIAISEEALKTISETKQLSFLDAISPILAWDVLKIDLTPREIKLRKSLEERGRQLVKTGILVLAIFILSFSILISRLYFKNAYLRNLNEEYASLDKEAKKLEEEIERTAVIKNYISQRGQSLDVFAELHELAPLELELNDIKFDTGSKFIIKGTAGYMSTVFSFVDRMEKSELFKDVKTKHTTKRKEGSRDVTDFEINCLINSKGSGQ